MKKANIFTAGLFAIFSIVVIIFTTSTFPPSRGGVPGPGVFPIMIASAMLLMALLIVIHYLRLKEDIPIEWFTAGTKRAYLSIGIMLAYVVLTPIVGFFATSFVFLNGIIKWFGKRSWLYTVIISLMILGFIYAVFIMLLRVPLQFGFLF